MGNLLTLLEFGQAFFFINVKDFVKLGRFLTVCVFSVLISCTAVLLEAKEECVG